MQYIPLNKIEPTTASQPGRQNRDMLSTYDTSDTWFGFRWVNPTIESSRWQMRTVLSNGEVCETFIELTEKWLRETQYLSSVSQIIAHPAYLRIIGMGSKAVPLILKQMKKTPGLWFWAISSITGENPITEEMEGDINAMTDAWLGWGRENGYC